MRAEPAPSTPTSQSIIATEGGRVRTEAGTAVSMPNNEASQSSGNGFNRPRSLERNEQQKLRDIDQQLPASGGRQQLDPSQGQGQVTRQIERGRWRNMDAQPQGGEQSEQVATPQPQEGRRRGGFFESSPTQPDNTVDQTRQRYNEQPQQRTYERPQRQEQPQQRVYEQPQQRSYEQPQQRSYEQPQRSEPSYSSPSNGGGNSGGGGGGGGRSRGRGE